MKYNAGPWRVTHKRGAWGARSPHPKSTHCIRRTVSKKLNYSISSGASAVAIRFEGGAYLIDCGEGTQTQIMALKTVKPANITKIFITHLHGDHMFGLPGRLS